MRDTELLEKIDEGVDFVLDKFREWRLPEFFLEFGYGFHPEALFDEEPKHLQLGRLPLMPLEATPDGCLPELQFGTCGGIPILVLSGHRHLFEGYGVLPCILPVCLAWRLGIRRQIFIESGIGLHPEMKVGTWTLLTDFINGQRVSPLEGLNGLLATPFPDMTFALSQQLNSELVNALAQTSVMPRLSVYQSCPGSHYCTPSEAYAARMSQADILGHDLVMEVITSHGLGCETSALALVSALAPTPGGRPLLRSDILEACGHCGEALVRGLKIAVKEIVSRDDPFEMVQMPTATADEELFRQYQRKTGREPVLKKYLKKREE